MRYGNEIALLDTTYRTTKYALPLYFLCVPTNVNYITVASFVLETEDRSSIMEAMSIIKKWNPNWKPQYFMSDYCDEEITALETVFPDTRVYLCDFHREQNWERWLGTAHNGQLQQKENALALFRAIARSSSEDELKLSKTNLEESDIWNNSSRLRNWFTKYWLNKADRWVQVRRQVQFNVCVNTNNGVERQNKSLKYEYLDCRKSSSLSHLLSVIVDKFLADSYKRYLQLNAAASDQARTYSQDIPMFLHSKPKHVVQTCFKRWLEADKVNPNDIDKISEGVFYVPSQTHENKMYEVNFNANHAGLPSCGCPDWKNNHLLCKHFFAVFKKNAAWGWDSLPMNYKNNPFINLDIGHFSNSSDFSVQMEDNAGEVKNVDCSSNTSVQFQLESQSAIKRGKDSILTQCRLISDLVHHCTDMDVLRQLSVELGNSLKFLTESVPKDGTFILEGDMLHIGTTKVADKVKKKYQRKRTLLKLPPKRTKRPATGRHGARAAMKRSHFTRKGAEELLSDIHSEDGEIEGKRIKRQADSSVEEAQRESLFEGCQTEYGSDEYTGQQKSTDFLGKAKKFLFSIDDNYYKKLVAEAKSTSHRSMDMTSRMGAAVIDAFCCSEDDCLQARLTLCAFAPPKAPETVKFRMVDMVLEHLVEKGDLKIPADKDPRVKQAKSDKLMEELLQSHKDKTHRVVFCQEAIKFKQSKMANLKEISWLMFNNTQLQRAHKGHQPPDTSLSDVPSSFKFTRQSSTAPTEERSLHLEECFICEKQASRSELGEAMTVQLNTRLHQCAENLQNQKVLATLSAGDAVAQELKYHGACLTSLYNKERAHLRMKQSMTEDADAEDCCPRGGLVNPSGKHLCFANALLQCLRVADINRILQYHTPCTENQTCFTCCLRDFMTDIPYSVEPLCRKMTSFWKNYKVGNSRMDAHELLHMMMEEIQQKCFGSEDICNEKRVFYGKEKSVVICNGCQARSSRSDVFSAISVSIEKHQNITQAIEGYFKEEEVEWKCDFCKKRTWAVKKTTLEEIPKNIVVQLQRFGGDRRKIMKKVDLHFDIYLRKYVEEHKVLEDKARLFGVIVHKGNTLTNGHYYAFIQFGTQWYLFDDLKVKQVSIQSLKDIEGQPYLLFYRALPRPYIS